MLHGLKDKIRSFNVENTNRKFRNTIKKNKIKHAIRKEENVQKKLKEYKNVIAKSNWNWFAIITKRKG